jgi:short-subunit dehydrogenase
VISKDLCKSSAPGELYDNVKAVGIDINVLVNNAGFGINGKFTDFSAEKHMDLIQLNIASLTMLCKLFGTDMIKKRSGSILNVASTAAFQAGPFMSTYYASKAYVLMFSEALNNELAQDGVIVTVLCPGPTQTEFFERNDMVNTNIAKSPHTMKAAEVAQAGYDGLMKGKRIVIPGLVNKTLAFTVRFTPRSIITRITSYLNQKTAVS